MSLQDFYLCFCSFLHRWPTYAKQPNPCFFFLSLSPPVSQSNSSLKKHRSRSIFSPFFCCFRNYNDYHVETPPANNKTLSLPPPPEENGSPPKVKLVFFLSYIILGQSPNYIPFAST